MIHWKRNPLLSRYHFGDIRRARAILATALYAFLAACQSNPSETAGSISPLRDCDPVSVVMQGTGKTTASALNDAARQAVAERLGEVVTYRASMRNEDLSESLGVVSRGTVASVSKIAERTTENGSQWVQAQVVLCRNNVRPFKKKAIVTSRSTPALDSRIDAFLDDVAARERIAEARKKEFDEVLNAVISPAIHGDSLHAMELATFTVELDERHLDRAKITAQLRIGLDSSARNDLTSLIEHIAIRKTGVFGGAHRKAALLPGGFGIFLGSYRHERGTPESYGYWSLYELQNWQAERIVLKIREMNEVYRRRALCLVGLENTERPLFYVPINRVKGKD